MASSCIPGYGDHHKNPSGVLGLSMEMMNVPYMSFLEDGSSDNNKKNFKGKKDKVSRIAFQTRSQVDILDDGYRWRKYGQKAVKDNKFPRSYYKCTHQGCHVKKQVQRKAGDEGVVVTTYVGVHSHPIDKPTDSFEQILTRMRVYTPI